MKNRIIDKWESIPEFVLNNEEMLFNGIYIPKGSWLNVHNSELIQFGFRGMNNPKILLKSPKWNLYELELQIKPYERVIPELIFSSTKLDFKDWGEKYISRKTLEGIVTGTSNKNVKIIDFEVFYLKEKGTEQYTDFEYYNERDKIISVNYDIDVDCGILTKLSNNKCVYFDYNAGHEIYNVFFGKEELIIKNAYMKTHWFDYPVTGNELKIWKKRKNGTNGRG